MWNFSSFLSFRAHLVLLSVVFLMTWKSCPLCLLGTSFKHSDKINDTHNFRHTSRLSSHQLLQFTSVTASLPLSHYPQWLCHRPGTQTGDRKLLLHCHKLVSLKNCHFLKNTVYYSFSPQFWLNGWRSSIDAEYLFWQRKKLISKTTLRSDLFLLFDIFELTR